MQKYARGLAWTVGILVVVLGLLRLLVVKVWTMPDDPTLAAAVAPTLNGGDVVLILFRGTPGFGDLVRCADPDDPKKRVVGRIVGVEGDVVEIKGRQVTVNGKNYNPSQACAERRYTIRHPVTDAEVELQCGVVEMGGGWHYRGFTKSNIQPVSMRTEVGKGMVFLLSDDLDHHDDTRDFGTVPRDTCNNRIFFRLWSARGWEDAEARLSFIH